MYSGMNATLPNIFDESRLKRFNRATSRFQYHGNVYRFFMTRGGICFWHCTKCQSSLQTNPSGTEVYRRVGSHNHDKVSDTRPDGTFEAETWTAFRHSHENFTSKTDAKPAVKFLKMAPTEDSSQAENSPMTSKSHNADAKKEPKGINPAEQNGTHSPLHSNSDEALDNLLHRSTDQGDGMRTSNDQESNTTRDCQSSEANGGSAQSRSSDHVNMPAMGQRFCPEFTVTCSSTIPHSRAIYGGNDTQIVKQYVNAMCASPRLAKTQSKVPAGYLALSFDHPTGFRLNFMGAFLCSACQRSVTPCHMCPRNPEKCAVCCKHEFRTR